MMGQNPVLPEQHTKKHHVSSLNMSSWAAAIKNLCMYVSLFVCMQGAGTAIGELPPYFMARAARLSGADPDDEDYQRFEEILDQTQSAQVTHRS